MPLRPNRYYMRLNNFNWLCLCFGFLSSLMGFSADYVNGTMLDIVQYERGISPELKRKMVVEAFQSCGDPSAQLAFFSDSYCQLDPLTRNWTVVTNDSVKLSGRLMNTCVMDLDGLGQKEILFHEYNRETQKQVSIILRKNSSNNYEVIFHEYGVISNMTFETKKLKSLHVTELHAFGNPCDKIKLYSATVRQDEFLLLPNYCVNVPYNYMYPVKVAIPDRVIQTTNDTLYMYYYDLFKGRNFPYKIEMRTLFDQKKKFNSLETKWPAMHKSTYYFTGFVEERDDFTAIMIAINNSFADRFPEYQFIYLPSVYILHR